MIETQQIEKIRPLFAGLATFQPMCSAVLEGIWPGRVWVDNEANPKTGLLITFLAGGGAAWCFLAGDPENEAFNRAVNKALFEEKIAGQETGFFLITCDPEQWGNNIRAIGDPRLPAAMARRHYVCHALDFDSHANLPASYSIHPLEPHLLQQKELEIPPQVKTILGTWRGIKENTFQDFGFMVIHENQVVAWATVDFVTGSSGDLGFETLPEFRQRGLGSAVAAAALAHGMEKGIETHWTCAVDNLGSLRTADKLGLDHTGDYVMYPFALDVHEHLGQAAYARLSSGDYQEAIDLYEQLFGEKADPPIWAYFDTAQAYAALENQEKAIRYLQMAVREGWNAADMTAATEEFKILYHLPEWESLLAQMRQDTG